jgi:hypothetical protein
MILYVPFILQGIFLFFDEFYFHHRRSLPTWERKGHPLDTFSVLICYLWLRFREPNDFNLNVYIGLAIFSCLLVTKDEYVHTQECQASEHWLHAVLFVLHPIVLMSAGLLWTQKISSPFLNIQIFLVTAFMIYQFLYWNLKWQKRI